MSGLIGTPVRALVFLAATLAASACESGSAPPDATPSATPSGAAATTGPAFDCAAAIGQVQTLICADPALAALDRRMVEVFTAAIAAMPLAEGNGQQALQRGWIKGRDDCWKETDMRGCTEYTYYTRLVELQMAAHLLQPPTTAVYDCPGTETKVLEVSLYGDTEPPSAMLKYGENSLIAFHTPAAGGPYAAPNVTFAQQAGEARLDWFGLAVTCRSRGTP